MGELSSRQRVGEEAQVVGEQVGVDACPIHHHLDEENLISVSY